MHRLAPFALIAACCLLAEPALAAKTYYIDQIVDYTTACPYGDLYDDTHVLDDKLQLRGWSGWKYVDADAWALDFREQCSTVYGNGGNDITYADAKNLAVFSGHGGPGVLFFGTASDVCAFNIQTDMRLGVMAGNSAGHAIYMSCDTLDKDSTGKPLYGGREWLRQQYGFHGITGDNSDAYGSFFDDTSTKTNGDAWLDRLSNQHAIVIAYENGTGDCWAIDASAKLRANVLNSSRSGGPACGAAQSQYQWCSRWAN
jgi:hypothetical protein